MSINDINIGINKTNKAIIAIGDSYTSGAGAIDDEIYDNYKWIQPGAGYPLKLIITETEKKDIIKKYPILNYNNDEILRWGKMEHENSYVNVLCKKYFNGEYTAINCGLSGGANRGRVKELYLNPSVNWDKINELIVIYCPTGPERFDFIEDSYTDWNYHHHYKTIWPVPPDRKITDERSKLWNYYGTTVYSEKSAIIEQISIVQELLTWCKLKKARLVITPAFDLRYNRETFEEILNVHIKRNDDWTINFEKKSVSTNSLQLLDLWPWELMFNPEGYKTFASLVIAQEPSVTDTTDFYFQFQSNRSPNGWITPCSHPGVKGHDLFARLLFEYLTK